MTCVVDCIYQRHLSINEALTELHQVFGATAVTRSLPLIIQIVNLRLLPTGFIPRLWWKYLRQRGAI